MLTAEFSARKIFMHQHLSFAAFLWYRRDRESTPNLSALQKSVRGEKKRPLSTFPSYIFKYQIAGCILLFCSVWKASKMSMDRKAILIKHISFTDYFDGALKKIF